MTHIPKLLLTNGSQDRLSLKFKTDSGFYNSTGPFEAVASGTSSFSLESSLRMASNGVVDAPCISHSNDNTSGIWRDSCVNFSSLGTKVSAFYSDGLNVSTLYQNPSIISMMGSSGNVMNANNMTVFGFDTILYQIGPPFATYVGNPISGSFQFTVPGYYFVSVSSRIMFSSMNNNKDRALHGELFIDGKSIGFQSRATPVGVNNYTTNILEVVYITSNLQFRGTTTINDAITNRISRERYITILKLF